MLNYCGTILSFIGAIYIGIIANNQNKRIISLEERRKIPILKLIRADGQEYKEKASIDLVFKNITDTIVVSSSIGKSKYNLFFKECQEDYGTEYTGNDRIESIFNIDSLSSNLLTNDDEFEFKCTIDKSMSNFFILSFNIEANSIYGDKSIQHFSILFSKVDKEYRYMKSFTKVNNTTS